MDIIPQLLEQLYETRMQRLGILQEIINTGDPQAVNYMIADMISMLENMYIMINIPPDGFVSLAPKDNDGNQAST